MSTTIHLQRYILPELGELVQEYEEAHFRHRGSLVLWTKSSLFGYTDMEGKGEIYKGVELKAIPGLWRVKLGPNKYQRIDDDDGYAGVFVWKSFILYTGYIEDVPSEWIFKSDFTDSQYTDVVLCSDNKPVFASRLRGKLFISSYGARSNGTLFTFAIVDQDSPEGKEIAKKYDVLYRDLVHSITEGKSQFLVPADYGYFEPLKKSEVSISGAELTIRRRWDFFAPIIAPQIKRMFVSPHDPTIYSNIRRVVIKPSGVERMVLLFR